MVGAPGSLFHAVLAAGKGTAYVIEQLTNGVVNGFEIYGAVANNMLHITEPGPQLLDDGKAVMATGIAPGPDAASPDSIDPAISLLQLQCDTVAETLHTCSVNYLQQQQLCITSTLVKLDTVS
jgi:hypothetical protein